MKSRLLTPLPKPEPDNSLYFPTPDDLLDWIHKSARNGTDIRLLDTVHMTSGEMMVSHYTFNRDGKLVEGWVLYKSMRNPKE